MRLKRNRDDPELNRPRRKKSYEHNAQEIWPKICTMAVAPGDAITAVISAVLAEDTVIKRIAISTCEAAAISCRFNYQPGREERRPVALEGQLRNAARWPR